MRVRPKWMTHIEKCLFTSFLLLGALFLTITFEVQLLSFRCLELERVERTVKLILQTLLLRDTFMNWIFKDRWIRAMLSCQGWLSRVMPLLFQLEWRMRLRLSNELLHTQSKWMTRTQLLFKLMIFLDYLIINSL
jgi:hypothetical protein